MKILLAVLLAFALGGLAPQAHAQTAPPPDSASQAAPNAGDPVSISCGITDLVCVVSKVSTWISDVVLFVPRKVFGWLMDALGSTIEAIPVPGFIADAKASLGGLPASVGWLLGLFQFKFGLTVVMTARVARFLLRRIPFIG